MLPSGKQYLVRGGLSPSAAAYALIGLFLAGVVGIQLLSRILHHFIPSHVVDCDHSHENNQSHGREDSNDEASHDSDSTLAQNELSERSPLLSRGNKHNLSDGQQQSSATFETRQNSKPQYLGSSRMRRPSFPDRLASGVTTFVKGRGTSCDENGPCYGFGDPCGLECFKASSQEFSNIYTRNSASDFARQPGLLRSATAPFSQSIKRPLKNLNEEPRENNAVSDSRVSHSTQCSSHGSNPHEHNSSPLLHEAPVSGANGDVDLEAGNCKGHVSASADSPPHDPSQAHHHHVPTNAFLSIGLQTCIAIALHKLPEGFITYATNHANPTLGFAVFIALFIHNITEGFAMALPLYLALGSKWKAMLWSSLLGGISQPLGAGVAALWFKAAGQGDMAPGERVYGGMFAVTSGIMTSVALQLFSESLGLTHQRNVCIAFAFVGMGILGVSFALTAG